MKSSILLVAMLVLPGLPARAQGAATGSGPTPIGGPGAIFRIGDNSRETSLRPREGHLRFALTIDPDGMPQRCRIVVSSGDGKLDRTTCLTALARARFTPAHDPQSIAIASIWSLNISWGAQHRPTPDRPRSKDYDLILTVPGLADATVTVTIREIVDANGTQVACTAEPSPPPPPPPSLSPSPRYGTAACRYLAAVGGRAVADVAGKPQRTLIVTRVLFAASPPEAPKDQAGAGQVYVRPPADG